MLGEKITSIILKYILINTGWSGGPYGVGKRMNLRYTRSMVRAALNGELEKDSLCIMIFLISIFLLHVQRYLQNSRSTQYLV